MLRGYFVLVLFGLLQGCSSFGALNALSSDRGHERIADLAYGTHARHRVDLYRTVNRPAAGTVVFFYGGGWEDGERENYRFVVAAFSQAGYDVAIPDYRVFPEIRFPVFVEDAAAATAWVAEHGSEHGLATDRIWLAGHSAGAHIAAMLHFDERYLAATGFDPERLTGLIGLAGAYDFLPLSSARLKEIFYPPEDRPASQPVNFVDGTEPPALLIHGTDDDTAWPRNTRRLAARIEAAGGTVNVHYLDGAGHVRPVLALSSSFRALAPVVRLIRSFLDATSGSQL